MFKPTLVGIGYVATGFAAIAIAEFILRIDTSPAVMTGVMAAMVINASYHAYNLGKKDRASDVQKVEQDRTTEGEED